MSLNCVVKLPEEGESEFFQFIPEELPKQIYEEISDENSSASNEKDQLIHCELLSVDDAISTLKQTNNWTFPPGSCNLFEKKLSPVEKLISLKRQIEQLQVESANDLPKDLLGETTDLLLENLSNYSKTHQISKTSYNQPENYQEKYLESRISNLEKAIGSTSSTSNTPLYLLIQELETKMTLLNPTTIETLYRKLKLFSIECEKTKEKHPVSESFELKVNRLYEKYSGLEESYLQIPAIAEKLASVEEMHRDARDVQLVMKELHEQKNTMGKMFSNLSECIGSLQDEFTSAKMNFEDRIGALERR